MRELHVYDCALMGCRGMRLFVAAALIGVTAPAQWHVSARADPSTCPPLCDQIPAAAWIAPESIPLNAVYRWPALPSSAVAMTGGATPRFLFEDVCATPPFPQDARASAVAARVTVDRPPGQWQLRAEVIHWRGDTTRGGAIASSVFDLIAPTLRGCQATAAAQSPSITVDEPNRLAAVISGPTVLRSYFVAHPENSTISELTLWAGEPVQQPWPIISDAAVLDAMSAPMCAAYVGSC